MAEDQIGRKPAFNAGLHYAKPSTEGGPVIKTLPRAAPHFDLLVAARPRFNTKEAVPSPVCGPLYSSYLT